jgi:septal ring factor EnvC (AmiA/AmiB activator)
MKWIRDNWAIISGVTVALCFIVGTLINHSTLETEMQFKINYANDHRERLDEKDAELTQRVKTTEKQMQKQAETLVRIETQQTAIQRSTKQTNKKIDKIDDKLDRLLVR